MTLHSVKTGSGPRIVLVHGFSQNGRCWGAIPEVLAKEHEVIVVDAPGHGGSFHDDADLWAAAELVGEVGGRAHYVGYSMGGRILLHLALARPDLVEQLTLIGASPGLEDVALRSERRHSDEELAKRIENDGLESFLKYWLTLPLFGGLTDEESGLDERLMNRVPGLAASLRNCGTGSQESLWASLTEISAPTLFLAGELDSKFSELGSQTAKAIGSNASFRSIAGASHSCHLESPDLVAAIIADNL